MYSCAARNGPQYKDGSPFERMTIEIRRFRETDMEKPKVIYFNRLASYAGHQNEDRVAQILTVPSLSDFMTSCSNVHKAEVTREEQQHLFNVAIDHCMAENIKMSPKLLQSTNRSLEW